MATKPLRLPVKIYVKWDEGTRTPFLAADLDADILLEGDPVNIGIYTLTEVRRGRLAPKWDSE